MSLARALTRTAKRIDILPSSTSTTSGPATPSSARHDLSGKRKNGQSIRRAQISSPVALVSTTNMLSYNAPDIADIAALNREASSASAKTKSTGRSSMEEFHSTYSSKSTPSLTDASSVEESLSSPASKHASAWQNVEAEPDIHSPSSVTSIPPPPTSPLPIPYDASANPAAPILPERALSHSKRAHEQLARKKSQKSLQSHSSLLSSPSLRRVRSSVEMARTSIDDVLASSEAPHPFHKELQQLEQVAEEFGGTSAAAAMATDAMSDEDELAYMAAAGLVRFGAAEYFSEIKPLFSGLYGERHLQFTAAWI